MPMECSHEKVATLLMWSGTEVTQVVLGNDVITSEIGEKHYGIMSALAHV